MSAQEVVGEREKRWHTFEEIGRGEVVDRGRLGRK